MYPLNLNEITRGLLIRGLITRGIKVIVIVEGHADTKWCYLVKSYFSPFGSWAVAVVIFLFLLFTTGTSIRQIGATGYVE